MASPGRFSGRVVWITGASSGIGEALAHAFHAEGARLILSGRRGTELSRVAGACSGGAESFVLPLDLAEPDALAEKAREAQGRFGRVDILVNNAGITHRALIADTEMKVFRRLFEVDFFGPLALSREVLPGMIARQSGHIVMISSITAFYGSPLRSGYGSAKAALNNAADSLRAENALHNVDVTVAVLGAIRTGISRNALTGDGSEYGRVNRIQQKGMDPARCAAHILDAVARGSETVTIASLAHRLLVWRARVAPRGLARSLRLKPRR